jgi:hypothetical protein
MTTQYMRSYVATQWFFLKKNLKEENRGGYQLAIVMVAFRKIQRMRLP